jgi:hypothetical protein
MAEFGDSNADLPAGTEDSSGLVEAADGALPEAMTEDDIPLAEIESRPQGTGMEA